MRTFSKWTALAALFFLVSCNQIEDFGDFSLRHKHGVLGEIAPVVFDDELGTKATIDPSSMGYRFEQGDHINVWSNSGTLLIYTVQEVTGGGTGAKFAGGGYTLTEGETYYSSVPLIKTFTENYHSLGLTYKGQVQVADNDADNCAEYTYTYASSTCNNGDASFSFNRMNAYMMFKLTLPENLTLKELQISVDDESFFALDGTADIATGAFTAGTKSGTMTLKLGGDAGIQVTDGVLNAFLSVAPCAAGEYVIRVIDSEDNIYTSPKISKTALEAGHVKLFETEVFEGENPGVAKIDNTVYASLAEAVAAVPADGTATTITMLDNDIIVGNAGVTIPANKNVVLDLNGKTITGTFDQPTTAQAIKNLGTLIITDGSTNQNGTITIDVSDENAGSPMAKNWASNVIRNEGTLTVNAGQLFNDGKGGACYAIDNYGSGHIIVNGGTIDAVPASAIRMFYNDGGVVDVNGGVIGHYNSDDDCAYMGIQMQSGTNGVINVSGGTIAGEYALYASGTGTSAVTISDGLFDGYVGFASAFPNNMSISGGMFKEWVGTWGSQPGFITGGFFAEDPSDYVADGYIVTDNTDSATLSEYPYTVIKDTNVYVAKIGDKKYVTFAAAIAAVQDGQTITLLENITLTEDLTWNAEGDAAFTLNYGEYSITKGNFSIKLKPGQTVYTDKTTSVSLFTAAEEGYVVKGTKDENGKYYYTVEEADLMFIAANGTVSYKAWSNTIISNSGTYKLLKDVTVSARIVPGTMASNVTLDLNGHILTSTATDCAVLLSRNGSESSPKIFNLIDSSDEKGGMLKVNPDVNIGIEVTGKYNQVTIGEGVTVDGDCVALLSENQTLTVNGTINGGNDFAVATNGGTTKNTTITINESAVLTSNETAMYLPGNVGLIATVNGGTITGGKTGIELRAGQLVVNGGNIISTATEYSYTPNDSGTTTKGAAIAVVQHNTVLPIDAQILGGTLTGLNQIAVVDAQANGLEGVSVIAKDNLVATTTIPAGFIWISDGSMSTLSRIPNVAKIGDTEYATLQAALDAAHEMTGDVTITLIANVTGFSIVHQKAGLNVTIDGAQKTVDGQIIIDGDGRATGTETMMIGNIKFQGDNTNFVAGTDAFVLVPSTKDTGKPYTTGKYNYAHNVTVSNCSFTSTASSLTIVAFKSTSGAGDYNTSIIGCTGTNLHSLAQLTGTTGGAITNNTVSSSESFVNVSGGTGSFNISGNTFTTATGSDGYGVRENGSSTAELNLSDNNFTATNSIVIGKKASTTNGTINITSGTYNGKIVKDLAAAATGKIVITGGSFDENPSDFVAPGYMAVLGSDNRYTVKAIQTVINDAPNGSTITLAGNLLIDQPIVIGNGKTIVLDLNGNDIYNTSDIWSGDNWSLISVRGGNLTVKGSGALRAKENDCYAIDIQDGGVLTINNGTYYGNISAIYALEGTAYVNGGEFYVQQLSEYNDARYMLNCLDASYKADPKLSNFIVSGGTFCNFNPGDNLAEGPNTNFLANGHTVSSAVQDGKTFYTVQ